MYLDKWDWEELSGNKALPWSVEFIEKYYDRWDWGKLSQNKALSWSIELIDSINVLEENENARLIETSAVDDYLYDKVLWHWEELCRNEAIPWSIELIEKYKEKWDWESLSLNQSALACLPKLSEQEIDEIMMHYKINPYVEDTYP